MKHVLRAGFCRLLVRDGVPRPPLFAAFLLIFFAAPALAQPPVINSLSQTVSTAGAAGYTLQVNTNVFAFQAPPQVFFGNTGLVTNAGAVGQWFAQVTAAVLATPGNFPVTMVASSGTSPAVTYTVLPAPTLTSLSQNTSTATANGFTLGLNGTNFVNGMKVNWTVPGNAPIPLTVTNITGIQILATVPAGLIASSVPGTALLTVLSPDGVSTASLGYTILPVPSISLLTPNNITAGHPQFTMNVSGSQVPPNSTVQWNGVNRATTNVSAGIQQATIPATDVATPGTASVTLISFDLVSSNSLPFTINGAPTITSFSPAARTAGQGPFTLTINGANFVAGDTVTWNGIVPSLTIVAPVTANQIQVTVPGALTQSPGTAQIAVISPDAVSSGNFPYNVNPLPTLTSISPTSHTATFGTFTLTINGTNFANGDTVNWFNGANTQLAIATLAANQITATVPAALVSSAGLATVSVVTPDAISTAGAAFTINPLPGITGINPTSHTAGAAAFTLTVNGTNFANGVTIVNWNGTPRPTTFVNGGQLTALISAADIASAGTDNVTVVVNTDGVSSAPPSPFTVLPAPAINSLSPGSHTAGSAGFTLTVNGANFVNGMTVNWNGSPRATTFVNGVNGTQLTALISAADILSPGTDNVTVVTTDLVISNASPFTVNLPPVITSLSPSSHTAGAASFTLTVNGANFVSGMTVNWNGSPRATTFVNATQLTAAIPATDVAAATTASVTVATADAFVSNASTFTVSPPLVISAISPSLRTATAPAFTLTVTGSSFVNGATVQWNGAGQSTTFVSATQLTASVPAALIAQPGNAQVTVISPDGVGSNQVPFQIAPIPTVTSLSPAAATVGSAGFVLTVTGTNFLTSLGNQLGNQANGGSQVVFGGTPVATTFVSATSLLAAIPASLIPPRGAVSVSVSGPGGVSSNSQVFTVNGSLSITSGPPATFVVGIPYIGRNTATGGTLPYVWSAGGLPSGLTINPATGDITGSPITGAASVITVTVTDASGQSATAMYNIGTSPPPPQIGTGYTLPPGTVGVAYVTSFGASGGNSSFSWSLSGGSLPDGLSLSASGFLSGTPTKAGTFNFGVLATDSSGLTASKGFFLLIQPAPLVLTGTAGGATVGSPLSITFGATGGSPPYKFGVSGSVPPGTSFSGGTLSGTPTSTGTFGFTVAVTDSAGAAATGSFSITVATATLAITGTLADGQAGVSYSAKLGATGGTPPYQFSGSGAPAGLSLSTNGTLSGTPTADGQFTFSVTLTDAAGAKATGTYSITIAPAALSVTTANLPDGAVNTPYSTGVGAIGGVKPYTITISGLPDGVTAGADGSIGGTPKSAGTFTVTATVKDATGKTATQSFTITIAPAPLTITASAKNGTVGAAYSGTANASGGVPPYTYSASGLPAGLKIASDTGAISGTPTAPGTTSVAITVKDSRSTTASTSFQVAIALPPAPPVTLNGISSTGTPAVPQNVQVVLGSPYPLDVTVTLILTFAPDAGADDPTVVFSTGGRTASVVIPAGATVALTNVGVQTGTVAGTITIIAQLVAGSTDITPTPAPKSTIRIAAAAPVVTSATATRNSTGFTVVVTGYATDREITQAIFTFAPASGSTLQTSSITIPLDTLFGQWYSGSASNAFGSQFTFTQPFTVQGSSQTIVSVTVTVANKVGSSAPITAALQ